MAASPVPAVLIVGAGPSGLVLALWLTKLGVPVRIIDKTAGPGTTSRALAVHARTLELYRQVGLADAMVALGLHIGAANIWGRGVRRARIRIPQFGVGYSPFPYVLIVPQDAHERLLVDRLQALGVTVERQTELMGFDQDRDGVRATIKGPTGAEERCEVPYLAGCDGADSSVRKGLQIGFPGGTYSGRYYVADVDASGPPANGELHVNVDDGDFLAVFPLGKGRVRLVGLARRESDREPTFDDVRGRAIAHMQLTITKVHWFSTYRVHHRVAERFRKGRAFLLGDAAHIHSPVGGQGMNTGIGDAVNLSWKLAAAVNDGAPDRLLDTYETERIRFARRLVATTDRAFSVVTRPGALAGFIRLEVMPRVGPLLLKLAPFGRFAFRTVSQIAITYRGSPLSAGTAGRVGGGDRLPWIETGPGTDNFDTLVSRQWQVHVYGTPRPDLAGACAAHRLPLHVFAWKSACKRQGLQRGALYLIRPDGYVGLAAPRADPEVLRRYLNAVPVGGPLE